LSDDADYRVVVTNLYGRATSSVAHLTVTQRPSPPRSLSIDFDARGTTNLESGFQRLVIPGAGGATPTPITTLFGGVEVTVSGSSGASLDDRVRATPVNGGAFTEEKLLQDFVFASDTSNRGIDVLLNFLKTNQLYTIT